MHFHKHSVLSPSSPTAVPGTELLRSFAEELSRMVHWDLVGRPGEDSIMWELRGYLKEAGGLCTYEVGLQIHLHVYVNYTCRRDHT